MQQSHAKPERGVDGFRLHQDRATPERPSAMAVGLAGVVLRPGSRADLEAVNRVVDDAVMGWDLPERVKRLSLPTYRYGAHDLEHLDLLVAVAHTGGILGVAAVEPGDAGDAPAGAQPLLLHGLYVLAERQGGGVGRRLVRAVLVGAAVVGWDGLLVKAQPSAAGFFERLGFERLPVRDPRRDYPHRYWQPVGRAASVARTGNSDRPRPRL